jgi:hypothetical protein
MEINLISLETSSRSATEKFPNIFGESKSYYHVYRIPSLVSFLSQIEPVNAIPFFSPRSILILSFRLHLGLRNGIFLSGFPINILYALLFFPFVLHDPPWLEHSNYTWRRVQVMKLLIMQFSPTPVTSSLFGPNSLLSTLFSNTLSLCSSVNVRDEVQTFVAN